MSHGRAQPRHRRRKSDFFGSPAKQTSAAPPVAVPEAADDEWVRCHDAATGASYYANRRSFEVSWTPPTAAVSPPPPAAAEASVAAPPPARARRGADAAWIGRGGAALAKATHEAPTPVVAPPSPPAPEPPSPPTPEPPPPPEPDDEPSYEEFVVVDERTDSGTEEGSGASYEEFEELEEVVVVAPEPRAPLTPEAATPEPAAEAPAAPAEPTPEPSPSPPEPAPTTHAAPPARRKTAQELLAALAEVSERLAPYAAAFAPAPRKHALLDVRGAPTRRGRALLAAARRCRA
ncbi:unnamed protein product [Pelagomonas calceolata]|uniref:WW domain-containing protein n=2 Tax=Pelagomonas calceolata TaxID=35677 RepID=A0A8J2ST23_9STRA|nr:unnamed protein product [Pelagomonas calceolata]